MRKWTLSDLESNLRKRFGDKHIFVEQVKGQIQLYRRPPQEPNRKMVFLKLSSLASKDYILKRMYEMDTASVTLAERELNKDKTDERIEQHEKKKQDQYYEEQMKKAWLERKRQGKGRVLI